MKDKKLSYHLHQYKYLWRDCTKRETVINAWNKLRRGKAKRIEVIEIESNFDYYVDLMIETLSNTKPGGDENKALQPKKLKPKHIKEHGKDRIIFCPSIWEQWIHHIIVQVLAPIVTKYSYKYSCGSMPKRGGVYGKRELERIIKKKGFKYFAKLDICHFFNNVKLDVVIHELEVFVDDEWFIYLIRSVFKYFKEGLPLGFYISQWLANFVLCRVDWLIMRHNPICYIRYMDDFVICGNNKRYLNNLIKQIKFTLGRTLRLRLKRNYQIIRFIYTNKFGRSMGRPIDFMGFVFDRKHVILRRRIMIKCSKMALRLNKLITISVKQSQGMLSRLGWFKHTSTKYLYIKRIQPYISIKSLKQIVSKYQRRINNENRMERRIFYRLSCAV